MRQRNSAASRRPAGFTLLELMVVIAIIATLLAMIAIPNYMRSIQSAREAVLKENLYVLRSTIEQFTLDKKRPPNSLEELVSEGYLRSLPKDITGTPDTWMPDYDDLYLSPEQASAGITDVHSGSTAIASDGTPYNSW